ncbi:MAG: DUF2344 domain-containing protein [Ruminococcus sp.]|nr:DUF2344 domain-containing protein [Ruminococcus sp.]
MKVRIKFKKYGALRFIGHLDVMRFFQKALRRANIPVAFTQGFSPHMIMSFASPLGIGITSDGEYFDAELTESISTEAALRQLNEVMVEGIEVTGFCQIAEEKKMTGMAIVAAADYLVSVKEGALPANWKEQLNVFANQPEISIMKQTKRSERMVDIRPMIYQISVKENSIFMKLAAGSVENLKPDLVMEAFLAYMNYKEDQVKFHYHRLEMYADMKEGDAHDFVSLESLGKKIL